jgi:hypothetical protein
MCQDDLTIYYYRHTGNSTCTVLLHDDVPERLNDDDDLVLQRDLM